MKNAILNSNLHSYYKLATLRIHNWTHLVLNAFRRIKIALSSILCKSNKSYSSSTCSSSEFKVLPPGHSKITGFLFMSFCIIVHIEEMYTAKNMTDNRATNAKHKRSIKLEMNKTEFWSVNSE